MAMMKVRMPTMLDIMERGESLRVTGLMVILQSFRGGNRGGVSGKQIN